ncbi:hypothetical protein KJ713_03220 [Patescibacteria group bacterium]|nr:hypothetical protein [Patescibacteria group bacterium]
MWQIKKSRHYIFHYFPNSLAEKEIKEIVKNQEATYFEILDFLGVKNNKIINYFLYPDNKIKGEMMGDDGNGNTVRDKFEVHAVYKQDIKCIGAHEDTHLLSLPLGLSVELFREGLAEFMSKTWHHKSHNFWVRKYLTENKIPDLSVIIDDEKWDKIDDMVSYPCAGSFVKFLIRKFGKEKFFELYKNMNPRKGPQNNLKKVFEMTGKTIFELQREWERKINT